LGTLKFKKGGMEFEYVGEPQEIEILINRLSGIDGANALTQTRLFTTGANTPTPSTVTIVSVPQRLSQTTAYTRARISAINLPLFPDVEVKAFLKTKSAYRHTLAEVQEHFFGKKFGSRGESASMYHRTSRQLVDVRRLIENEENGIFRPEDLGANVIEYTFVKKEQIETVGTS
jgi:hypothetical protein